MTHAEKLKMLGLKKEKLEQRLTQLIQKEKTLSSVAKKERRAEEEKRKYKLGGLVLLAFSVSDIEDFDDAEMLGALMSCYKNNNPSVRAIYKKAGEKILFNNRQYEKQSASAQGFTQNEILAEAVSHNAVSSFEDFDLMAVISGGKDAV